MAEPQSCAIQPAVITPAPNDDNEQPFLVRKRIAVLGARGVGKTAVSIRCAMQRFESDYMLTFEATYKWKPVVDAIHYDVSIVDTDGQDENSFFGLQYTIGVDGYVLMFSVCDTSSFEVIKAVNDKLLDTLNVFDKKGTSEVPRILVGNCIDLQDDRRVSFAEAKQYADDQRIPYIETSAFTSQNVTNAFTQVLQIIQTNLRQSHSSQPSSGKPENKSQEAKESNNACSVQ